MVNRSTLSNANRLLGTLSVLTYCAITGAGLNVVGPTVLAADPWPSARVAAPLETYEQRLTIVFTNAEAMRRAEVQIEPLFNGCHRAVSCRWDDNWTSDNEKTRDVMEECGVSGTWYLNGQHFHPGGRSADYLPITRKLLVGGNSVGGHSLTHPYLTYFHSHRMFAETSGVRINWEAALDQPVVSYAYSFIDLRPLPEGGEVLERSLSSLERAGYYHLAEFLNFFDDVPLRMELSPIMPPENASFSSFQQAVDWAYHDAELSRRWPMISNSMHAWYGTERLDYEYDELRKRLRMLANLESAWHCNQNEYAAYRRQVRSTQVRIVDRRDNKADVAIRQRPSLVELNDATPITITVTGVSPDEVADVTCPTATVAASQLASENGRMFHVWHDRKQQLPTKTGHAANPNNLMELDQLLSDPDFPQVRGILCAEGDQLRLRVTCQGESLLENVQVAWRLPIGWQQPSKPAYTTGRTEALALACPLKPRGEWLERIGRAHFAAQVDFYLDGKPGRIHFTCQRPGNSPNDSLPLGNFALLGPISRELFDAKAFAAQVESNGCPDNWVLADGSKVLWRSDARDGYVKHEWLNPEYIRTMGTWDSESPTYVMRSRITSPAEQSVKFIVSQAAETLLILNGTRIDGDKGHLRAGANELIVVYPGRVMQSMHDRLCACYLRIVDCSTGERLEDITYQAY